MAPYGWNWSSGRSRLCSSCGSQLGSEVFGDPPGMRLGELQRHPASDSQSTRAPPMITGHIRSGQQGFDRVHIAIDAAVVVEVGEVAVPGVDEHSGLVVEEPLVPDVERFGEQVASTGQPSNSTRRRRPAPRRRACSTPSRPDSHLRRRCWLASRRSRCPAAGRSDQSTPARPDRHRPVDPVDDRARTHAPSER